MIFVQATFLVDKQCNLKIIDLGFGKRIQSSTDFEKSISLNWWCPVPKEFLEGRYDFSTEVYFVGRLFKQLTIDNGLSSFKYSKILEQMCEYDSRLRPSNFSEVDKRLRTGKLHKIGFTQSQITTYRAFADAACKTLVKIESGARYVTDVEKVRADLASLYQQMMLEEFVPDPVTVISCLLSGTYYFSKSNMVRTAWIGNFVALLQSSTEEQNRIILANLHTRLDSIKRYSKLEDDDIPF